MSFNTQASSFLAQKRIAVAGVSRQAKTGNYIYKTMRNKGYEVFPLHPEVERIEGDTCYANLKDIPGGVEGLILVTRPEIGAQIVQDCPDAGVKQVWMHDNAFAPSTVSSISEEAVAFCKANGIEVIAGGCPMMFLEFGHKCMRWMMGVMGRLPE